MASASDNKVTCKVCGDANIFTISTAVNVYCECTNGHSWREPYQDQGGMYPRPHKPVQCLEDLLTPNEISLYQQLITEITRDIEYYQTADPADKAKRLSEICGADSKEIYILFKKITMYQNIMKGG
ncbi:hypothetical protein [Dethiobacter alkaliphilus]|uniref:hypothetical protein n=1 Tax=Dethiobacter alkaliphilus TaxID=427926 RepID=UPI002227ABD7|nr:hypothetical protein [Dethiobacter alkaliphilus]MCW3490612.1 hypothetical protein [Dethiobacter alkaliphilus]